MFFWNDNATDETGFQVDLRLGTSGSFFRYTTIDSSTPGETGPLGVFLLLPSKYSNGVPIASGTIFQFRIRAYTGTPSDAEDTAAYSPGSNIFSVTIPATTFRAPTGVKGTPLPESAKVTWTDASTSEDGVELWMAQQPGGAYSKLGDIRFFQAQQINVSGLAPGVGYRFKLRAYRLGNADDTAPRIYTAFSAESALVTPGPAKAPTGLSASNVGPSSCNLSWTDNSDVESIYEILSRPAGAGAFTVIQTAAADATSASVTNLTPGVSLDFAVRARTNYSAPPAVSENSNVVTVTPTALAAPTGLSISGVKSSSLTLSWTDNATGETCFEILSRPTGTGTFHVHQIAQAGAASLDVINLTPGVSLDFAVRARADYNSTPGYSENSNVVTQLMHDEINSPHYIQALAGQPIHYTLTTTSGSAQVSRTISGLPSGLSFDGTAIMGTPDSPGVTLASMSATFADAWSHSPGLAIRVLNPPAVGSAIPAQTLSTGVPVTIDLSDKFTDPEEPSAVKVTTSLGSMHFILFNAVTPQTVANFMSYVNSGGYNNNLFHRSVPGFVVQGGAFKAVAAPSDFTAVPKLAAVMNEPGISSIRGTIAMAKQAGDPNSATDEFFVNLENNGAILDAQNGGFTVFGRVAEGGMSVADAIALKPTGSYLIKVDGTSRSMDEWPLDSADALPGMDNTKVVGITSVVPVSVFNYAITSNTNAGAVSAAISGGNLVLTPVGPGTTNVTVEATNLEGFKVSQTFAVTTKSSVATLSKLVPGTGALSPAFSSGTTAYTVTVPNSTTSIKLTPTLADALATVLINGAPAVSGSASGAIPLLAGSNPITVLVTAADGVTTKAYTVNVKRTPLVPAVTTLSATGTGTTEATLNGTVNARGASATASFDYGLTTAYGSSIAATPSPVAGESATAVSAVLGGLTPGKTYHYRARGSSAAGTALGPDKTFSTVSTVATLSKLVLSAGTLSPAFSSTTMAYAATVSSTTTALVVTPTLAQAQATVQVNGAGVPSGKPSGAIVLAPGENTISILVTAQDGLTTKTYSLTVIRAQAPVVATLAASSIGATAATFNGTVNAGGPGTAVSFDYGLTTAYGSTAPGAPALVSGNGITSVSAALANLTPGATYHYRIRGANIVGTALGMDATFTTPTNLATLSALGLSAGALSPAFASGTTAYTATVGNATGSLTVTPTAADAANTAVAVNGMPVASGTASDPIDLNVGINIISVIGTARDGVTTKTYTIKVTRSAALASVTTLEASGVGAAGATLNGTVDTANDTSTAVSFDYGLTTAYGKSAAAAPTPVAGTASTSVSATMGGLAPGKTYHYRVKGVNSMGSAMGGDKTFTTKNNLATLSGLVLSSGALKPAFAGTTTSYAQSVPNAGDSLTVKPTATSAAATLLLNGAPIASGSTSGDIPLAPGLNTLIVQVTAEDGVTTKTYTVNVTRLALPVVATLDATNVTATGAKLNGTIDALNASTAASFDYGLTTAYGKSAVATPTPVTGTGQKGVSATLAGLLPGNTYHCRLKGVSAAGTAPGSDKTFTTPNNVATLSGITLNAGATSIPLSPVFTGSKTAYTAAVDNATESLTVTPSLSDANGTVKVNGLLVPSGNPGDPIDLNVGVNTITVVGIAQDGVATKTYTIKVTRSAALASVTTQAAAGVGATGATLNGTVDTANNTSTAVSFDFGLTTAYGSSAAASPTPVTGATSTPVSAALTGLKSGATYHYRIRGANAAGTALGADVTFNTPSNVATLSGLVLSSGALKPAFAGTTTAYTQTVPNSTSSLTIRPTATSAAATLSINGTAIPSGTSTGAIELSPGLNTFTVQVTAQDGVTKKTYTVGVTRLEPPVVLTIAATNVTAVGAKLNGALNALNSSTAVSFEYGTTLSYGKSAPATPSPVTGMTATAAGATLTGLIPGTTYHFRIKGVNAGGTSRGDDETFKTPSNVATLSGITLNAGATSIPLSPVFTGSKTAYTATVDNATDSLTVTPTSSDANATVTVNDVTVASGSASGAVALLPGVNIVRVVVTAQDGVATKTYTVMVTRRAAPVVTTLDATNVTAAGAKLNGLIHALNVSTAASFDYGLTTAYGKSAVATPTPVTGSAVTAVSATLTGLLPGNTYHYRLKGVSAADTGTGSDATFTTLNNVATLSGITLNAGATSIPLSPVFTGSKTAYTATVDNATASLTVTPSWIDANATVKVNGLAVASGNPSDPIGLNVGVNTISIVGMAEDGVTTKTYTIKVTRSALAPTMTTLAATGVSATGATLNGTSGANDSSTAVSFDYGLTTAYGRSAVATPSPLGGTTVTPVSAVINGLVPGSTYHYRVKGVNIAGTAPGTDMTFTTPSNVAALSGLVFSTGPLSPAFAGAKTSYTQNLLDTTDLLTATPTAANPHATVTVNGMAVASGNPSQSIALSPGVNTITVEVTAQDLVTKTVYTVNVTRPTPAPTVATQQADGATATNATVHGTVNAQGTAANVSFDYGLTAAYGSSAAAAESPANGNSDTPVTAALTGLLPGRTYHYRVTAQNAGGLSSGLDATFNTPSNVAALSGLVLSTGALNPGFSSATTNYTQTVPTATSSLTVKPTAAHAAATLLLNGAAIASGATSGPIPLDRGPNTLTIQVTAEDGIATENYTVTVTRTTPPPTVVTQQADNVGKTGATLHGTVNAEATPTTVSFDYGLTTAYGSSAAAAESPVNGTSVTPVTAALSGLLPGRTYHYRVRAQNVGGLSNGLDAMFTTVHEDVLADLSPATTSSASTSPVVLSVTNLVPGEPVAVERFVDADADGAVDGGEFLAERFVVTDGQVTSIGGVRNTNVPGDEDGAADGQASIHINPALGPELGRLAGAQIIRVSSPTGAFPPVTHSLGITHPAQAQSITGTVTDGTNPVPRAMVVLLHAGGSGGFALGAVADAAGQFTLQTPVGSYEIFAVKGGYVASFDPIALGAGDHLTRDIQLAAATTSVSGRVADAATSAGLGGVQLFMQSPNGRVTIASSNADGAYSVQVTAELWEIQASEISLRHLGHLGLDDGGGGIAADTTSAAATGVDIDLPSVTALIHGTVADSGANPLAGIRLGAGDGPQLYMSEATTDGDGHFVLGVATGPWQAFISNDSPGLAGYVIPDARSFTIVGAQAVQADFTLIAATAQIAGSVKDAQGNPIDGVHVSGSSIVAGAEYLTSTTTDAAGNYSLPVFAGEWSVGVSNSDLQAKGFVSPADQSTDVSTGTATLNFIAPQATGAIVGSVKDGQNNPIVGVQVSGSATAAGLGYSASAITDADGNYSLPVFAGDWSVGVSSSQLLAQGYVSPPDQSAGVTTGSVALDFIAPQATATITGSVKDGQNNAIVGVRVFGSATLGGIGYSTSAVTDAGGIYSMPVFSGDWNVNLSNADLLALGYLSPSGQGASVDTGTTTLNFVAPQARATIFGIVKTPSDVPVPNAVVTAHEISGSGLQTSAVSNANGEYTLGVVFGMWDVGATDTADYVGERQEVVVSTSASNVQQDLVVHPFTAQLRGQVLDDQSLVVSGVRVVGSTMVAGSPYSTSSTTDASGYYEMQVFAGDWAVSVSADDLLALGYQAPPAQNAPVTSGTVTLDFNTGLSSEADLSSLVLSSGMLTPAFAPATPDYTATVSDATMSITVTPTLKHSAATVKVNNATVPSGSASAAIDLVGGPNIILILSTAQDGVTSKIYTLTVTRLAPAPEMAPLVNGAAPSGEPAPTSKSEPSASWTQPGPLKARLTGPTANGGALPGESAAFTWDPGLGVNEVWLSIGSSVGGADLYDASQGTALDRTVRLPTDGSDVYVTLKSKINGAWLANNYVFVAADTSIRAVLSAPADQTKLAGTDTAFTWDAVDGADEYWLTIGSTEGGADIYDAGQGSATGSTLSLPADGREMFVTLKTRLNGAWTASTSTLFASGSGAPTAARITSPANHSTLEGGSITLTWDAGSGVSEYWLTIGTSVIARDVYDASQGGNQAATVTVPTDGGPLYISIHSLIDGKWQSNQYFYEAAVVK